MIKVILTGLMITGCASTPPPQRPIIMSNSQFDCLPDPNVPSVENMSDAQLAVYITRLQAAGEDCRSQLSEVKDVIIIQGGTVTDILVEAVIEKKKRFLLF